MRDPATHVVEYALREHFGAPEVRDVTWRVLRELRRPGRAERRRRRLPRTASLAAAAVLTATAGALWLWSPSPPRAQASMPLAVYDPTGESSPATELAPGRITLVPAEATIELPDGTAFEAAPGTVFRWSPEEPALELFAGVADVRTLDGALVVQSATGTLELSAHGRARLEVTPAPDLEPRTHLARSLSMKLSPVSLPSTLAATLLAGSGTLFCGGPPHPLALGRPVVVDPSYGTRVEDPTRADENPFELEPGVWDLFEPPDAPERTGLEIVRVGPHPHSLLSDVSADRGGATSGAHVVLKYEADSGRITGSLVDSFGGPIGVLQGGLDDEGGRVLELHRVDGSPFGLRLRMSWVADDERRTVLESRQDGGWRTVRETAHRRRPEREEQDAR